MSEDLSCTAGRGAGRRPHTNDYMVWHVVRRTMLILHICSHLAYLKHQIYLAETDQPDNEQGVLIEIFYHRNHDLSLGDAGFLPPQQGLETRSKQWLRSWHCASKGLGSFRIKWELSSKVLMSRSFCAL